MKGEMKEEMFKQAMTRRDFMKKTGIVLGAASMATIPSNLLAEKTTNWKYY